MNPVTVERALENVNVREVYDYIGFGAWSSGCLVAARLSENPDMQVLLLEAGGPDTHEAVENPVMWPIYKKIEDYAGGANAYRGAGGPLYMELPRDPNPLAQTFIVR